MKTTVLLATVLGGPVIGAALWGCASRPTEHFYTVSTEKAASDTGAVAQPIVISPIVIPALIDRPQLVVRTAGHEVAVLENHRWAEPLAADLRRALVDDLRRARPGLGVVTAETPQTRARAQRLDVMIAQLVSAPGTSTWLEASWVLHDRERHCAREGHLEAVIPTPAGYDAIPTAYADAMSRLADAMARTVDQGVSRDSASCVADGSTPPA